MAITRNMPKRKRSEHYVNNKEFLAALIRYREDVERSRGLGDVYKRQDFNVSKMVKRYI